MAANDRRDIPRWSIRPIRPGERPALRRLVQLYLYDLGGDRWPVAADGTFAPASWHRRFWARRGKHHFVIRVEGRLAGFALVSDRAQFAGRGVREIGEFFVLRGYRRRGLGTCAAEALLARFPGRWEVAELPWNTTARRFWRRVIARCAAGAIDETRRRHGDLGFWVQHFEIRRRAGPSGGGDRAVRRR